MKKHLTASHQVAHPHDNPQRAEVISLTEGKLLAHIEAGSPALWITVRDITRPSSKSHKRVCALLNTHYLALIESATDYDHLKSLFPDGAPINPHEAFDAYRKTQDRFLWEKFKKSSLDVRVELFIYTHHMQRQKFLDWFKTVSEKVDFLSDVLAHIKNRRLRSIRQSGWIQNQFIELSLESVHRKRLNMQ